MQGDCIDIGGYGSGGFINDIEMNGLHCHGMNRGVSIIQDNHTSSAQLQGNYGQIIINDADFLDIVDRAIYMVVNPASNVFVKVTNSVFNMDPYDKNSCRAAATTSGIQLAGSWANSAASCGAIPFSKDGPNGVGEPGGGSLLAVGNTIMNAPTETNVDPTDPTTQWTFRGNYDLGTFNSYKRRFDQRRAELRGRLPACRRLYSGDHGHDGGRRGLWDDHVSSDRSCRVLSDDWPLVCRPVRSQHRRLAVERRSRMAARHEL